MNNERDRDVAGQAEVETENSTTSSRKVFVTDDRIDSRALFGSSRQITIAHGTEAYTLRVTAQNKLILTK
jgi:hemin uptake protein HemP